MVFDEVEKFLFFWYITCLYTFVYDNTASIKP